MRTYLIVTMSRRGGECFTLKTPRQEVIGTMRLNAQKGRHEMELSEADFLKYAKDLAGLCAVTGMATYVAEIRANGAEQMFHVEQSVEQSAPDDLDGKPYFSLVKIAKQEKVDISGVRGLSEIRRVIREHRALAAA